MFGFPKSRINESGGNHRLTLCSAAQWFLLNIISTLSLGDLDYSVKTIRFLQGFKVLIIAYSLVINCKSIILTASFAILDTQSRRPSFTSVCTRAANPRASTYSPVAATGFFSWWITATGKPTCLAAPSS